MRNVLPMIGTFKAINWMENSMLEPAEVAGRMLEGIGMVSAFDDLVISTPGALPLVETGEYEATCISCRKEKRFKRDLLALKFKLATQDQYFGIVLDAYINLDFGQGATKKAPPRSKLAAWIRLIAKFDPSINVARFKVSTFASYLFIVKVESSGKNSDQRDCEPCSRVTHIVDVVGRLGGVTR